MNNTMLPLLLLASACSHAAAPQPPAPRQARFDTEVREDFFDGFRGDEEALSRGMKRCEEILAKDPDHAEALVWHGSGLAFRSGAAFRSGHADEGMKLYLTAMEEVDRAVSLRPGDVAVRIPRGAMLLAMTMNMPDGAQARALVRKALDDYEMTEKAQRATWNRLSVHARGQLLFGLADGYDRLGDAAKARPYYQRLIAETPTSPLAPRSRDWLDGKPHADKVSCIGCHVE